MVKKWTALLLVSLWLCLAGAVLPCAAAENLLQNRGFEENSGGQPGGWQQDVWTPGTDATQFSIETGNAHTGSGAVKIENKQPNDAKLVQTVAVKPNTSYRLSGFIRAEQADPSAKGANLSVMGPLETSADYKDTKGEWQYVELYGRTGPEQNELKVAVRLGGYGSLTKGTAYFDDIAFEEVSQVPAGVKAISFLPQQAAPAGDPATSGDPVSPMKVMLFTVLFGALFVVVYQSLIRSPLQARGESRYGAAAMAGVLGLGLLLRFYIGQHIVGHPTDVNTFTAWAKHAAEAGLMRFYDGIWADYPPGYIYVLYAIGKLAGWMHLEASSKAFLVLLKLPAILADLAAAWLVYRLAQPRFGDRAALGLSLLYAFNPAVIADSAAWGQVDSVFTLLLLATLLQVVRGRLEWACVLFALTVLIKPQALIFTPALLYAFIRAGSWKRFGVGALWGLAGLVIPLLPFSLNQGSLLWVVDLYKTTLKSYPYATLNAFNLYSLVGANWKPITEKLLFLPYSVWGNLFIVAAVGLSAYLFFRRKEDSPAKVLYTALILIAVVFLLAAKMHERYLYPAVALVLVAYVYARDRRLLWLFLGFSLTAFINIGYVLAFSLKGITNVPAFDGIMLITSLVNLVLLGWLIQVGVDLFVRGRIQPVEPVTPLTAVPAEAEASGLLHSTESAAKGRKFTRRDWIGMGAVTAVYAVVALYNLGSFSAPQTFWQPARTGDSFYVDLGESRTIERINTFSEIGEGKFKLEFGDTPTAWTNPLIVDNTYVKVFLWNVQPVNVKARYVKVTVDSPGFTLDEMALFEKDNEEPLPLKVAAVEAADPVRGTVANLFDEQDKAKYKPTYLDGTYFDEIYHARTAYEHLHLMKPYENTHPPLGKELILIGIKLFGMTPFGWRIVGTLFGIGMIPILYVFALRLFGKSQYALFAAFLMAVDFMHFAQTRIATIDVYGVFFIMLMYYFMYRYYSLSFYQVPLKKTLVPLFLSGLFFGIGAASKWIVLYGGAGLALLFFLSLYERYRQYAAAGQMLALEKGKPGPELTAYLVKVRRVFVKYTAQTVAWCTLFFVVIPAVIYSLSFVPIMSVPGEKHTVEQLVQYQKDMYNYHSKLKATHSFGSPWYEWPFLVRPIWYYTGQSQLPPDQVSSIVSMGNPAVWWVGLLAFLATLVLARRQRHRGMLVVIVAFFSQYVPWMLVTRLTFIYHYFAMVPFLILSIVYVSKLLVEARPAWRKAVYAYSAVCLLLFIMFYPVLSGAVVSKSYVEQFLRWFPTWYFNS